MHVNERLENLYSDNWQQLIENGKEKEAANPLLIKVSNSYIEADLKVMIFGQETYGWNGTLGDKNTDIEFLMSDYDAYLHNDEKYEFHYKNRLKRKRSRSFWSRKNFLFFQEKLKYKGVKTSFLWNNLAKIGNSASAKNNGLGKQSKAIKKLEESYFQVFEEELEILNPDLIIFRTGNRHIPNSTSAKLTKVNPATTVKLEKFPNILAIKSYHPNSRVFSKESKYKVLEVINSEFKELM